MAGKLRNVPKGAHLSRYWERRADADAIAARQGVKGSDVALRVLVYGGYVAGRLTHWVICWWGRDVRARSFQFGGASGQRRLDATIADFAELGLEEKEPTTAPACWHGA